MIKTIRPKVELLNKDFIEKIINEALDILEKQGVFVENKEALGLFKEAEMKIEESAQRVLITPQLVQDSLSSCPPVIKLYDRTGEKEFVVGQDEVHFNPGSVAVTILDQKTQEQRKAVTEDVVKFVRLTECMESIDFQSTGIISSDVPDIIQTAIACSSG